MSCRTALPAKRRRRRAASAEPVARSASEATSRHRCGRPGARSRRSSSSDSRSPVVRPHRLLPELAASFRPRRPGRQAATRIPLWRMVEVPVGLSKSSRRGSRLDAHANHLANLARRGGRGCSSPSMPRRASSRSSIDAALAGEEVVIAKGSKPVVRPRRDSAVRLPARRPRRDGRNAARLSRAARRRRPRSSGKGADGIAAARHPRLGVELRCRDVAVAGRPGGDRRGRCRLCQSHQLLRDRPEGPSRQVARDGALRRRASPTSCGNRAAWSRPSPRRSACAQACWDWRRTAIPSTGCSPPPARAWRFRSSPAIRSSPASAAFTASGEAPTEAPTLRMTGTRLVSAISSAAAAT